MTASAINLAYFVSPHGYGHAARASAVMVALTLRLAQVQFQVFTKVPRWFFQDPSMRNIHYHSLLTDIGLAQKTALQEDVPETLRRLADFMPFDTALLDDLAQTLHDTHCQAVLCDISPLGIAVAQHAGLPSVLIENFTWDWIYAGYVEQSPQMGEYVALMADYFAFADYHIQTTPFCQPAPTADLITAPVSRPVYEMRLKTREKLRLSATDKIIMLTMGGIPWDYATLDPLTQRDDVTFIIPGGSDTAQQRDNLILLPHHNRFFHPHLVNASDVVIGKLGYSTLAEVYQARAAFGYIERPAFPESQVLAEYVQQAMPSLAIDGADFIKQSWLDQVPALFALPRRTGSGKNGANEIAEFLIDRVM